MSAESRLGHVERGTEEIVTRQELIGLLDREAHPKAYIGYEPSGFVHIGNGIPVADKIKDLVLHFESEQTGIDAGDTQACLTGKLFDTTSVEGCDSIKTK